jgi:hypothetical protein
VIVQLTGASSRSDRSQLDFYTFVAFRPRLILLLYPHYPTCCPSGQHSTYRPCPRDSLSAALRPTVLYVHLRAHVVRLGARSVRNQHAYIPRSPVQRFKQRASDEKRYKESKLSLSSLLHQNVVPTFSHSDLGTVGERAINCRKAIRLDTQNLPDLCPEA